MTKYIIDYSSRWNNSKFSTVYSFVFDHDTRNIKLFPSIDSAKRYLYDTVSMKIVWEGNVGTVSIYAADDDGIVDHLTFHIKESK